MVQIASRQYEWLFVQRHGDADPATSGGNGLLRWLVAEGDRASELPLAVLPVRLRNPHDLLEQREELLLRGSDDRVGDLRLLPEDLPVRLLSGLHAVQFGLPRTTLPTREELPERHVECPHLRRE